MSNKKQAERDIVYQKYDGHCAYCGCTIDKNNFCIDHIIPKLRTKSIFDIGGGGPDNISNYNPSCRSCNIRKDTMNIEEFRSSIEATVDNMMRDSANFRQMIRFGQIEIHKKPIVFFFET